VTGAYDVEPQRLAGGAGTLACTIPSLPLLTGSYQLRTSITEAQTLQPLALHGYDGPSVALVVDAPTSLLHNGLAAVGQLVTLDVDWD
jgi:hypothetical protein